MKDDLQNAINQKKERDIYNLIPRTQEFPYSTKIEKLEPLLENNPVKYDELLKKLLVPQVHVGKNYENSGRHTPGLKDYLCFISDKKFFLVFISLSMLMC